MSMTLPVSLATALQVAPHIQDDFDLGEDQMQEIALQDREENQAGHAAAGLYHADLWLACCPVLKSM